MPNKKISKNSLRGKKSRARGQRFESKVRQELENLGWIVTRWMNTVDYDKGGTGKIIPAKRKYNPFLKALSVGTGFPDFVCFRRISKIDKDKKTTEGEIILVEPEEEEGIDNSKALNGAIRIPISKDSEEMQNTYEVIGLEVKGNGYLDKVEKGMCIWLLENKIFPKILIAKRGKRAGEIEYVDFDVKYNKQKSQ